MNNAEKEAYIKQILGLPDQYTMLHVLYELVVLLETKADKVE